MVIKSPDEMWEHLKEFKYKGTLTLKNLDNDLSTESWDALYHTGIYLIIAALRLKRTNDLSIVPEINEVLDVILKEGLNFRGYNSEGEYWKDYLLRNYYDKWHDKEVFRDTSRDQILSLNIGIYFLFYALNEKRDAYPSIFERVEKIVKMSVEKFGKTNYDLGTTYGNCQIYKLPFDLFYKTIDPSLAIERSKKSERYFRIIPSLQSIYFPEKQYFGYELTLITLYLIIKCFDSSNGVYPESMKKSAIKGFRRLAKSRLKDDNLFFELLYYSCTKEFLKERDFKKELNEIFEPFGDPKLQDFIWQRAPKDRYKPWEDWKNFYAPWHDYLIMCEMLDDLGLVKYEDIQKTK